MAGYSSSIIEDLEKLNFTVNESKVYLTLIKVGPSLAGRVAKEADLDRSSTYNALKLLVERGIISTVHENKRTIYVPADPKKIIDYYKEKEELAARIIPSLREIYAVKQEKKNVLLFQGYKGLKTIFEDILETCKNKEYMVIGTEGQFPEKMPFYSKIFGKRKIQNKIRTKLLIREGRHKESKNKFTEYKKIPSNVISPATINIYDKKVAIFIWDEKPEAILIENEKVSTSFKNYFNFMWVNAKKLKI